MQKIIIILSTVLTLISNVLFTHSCPTNHTCTNQNGTSFTKTGQVFANGTMNYNLDDAMPFNGTSYYRVKSVDKSGKINYTKIMPVTINNNAVNSLSINPNPLKGKAFLVQISNKAAGTYILQMINNSGQQSYKQTINYNGETTTNNIRLNNRLASGSYFI